MDSLPLPRPAGTAIFVPGPRTRKCQEARWVVLLTLAMMVGENRRRLPSRARWHCWRTAFRWQRTRAPWNCRRCLCLREAQRRQPGFPLRHRQSGELCRFCIRAHAGHGVAGHQGRIGHQAGAADRRSVGEATSSPWSAWASIRERAGFWAAVMPAMSTPEQPSSRACPPPHGQLRPT